MALLIYIASPYGATQSEKVRRRRVAAAQDYAVRFVHAIEPSHAVPYVPVAMWGEWAHGQVQEGTFEALEPSYIRRSDALWVLTVPGWDESVGVQREIELATSLELPVSMVSPTESLDLMRDRVRSRILAKAMPYT